ncbi:M48 family metallopeptidase [Aeromicrobium sp. CF4.19]|uniref:M48 metallopeptidase family protein n=1 Tax=Aeromicrobium sp. CF4.19 TaxID=3373082 RepID=UPI003EE63362
MEVEIRRSTRRKRNITARREEGRTVILMPAHLSQEEEQRHVTALVARLDAKDRRRHPGDDELLARAEQLSQTYLEGFADPASVRWVANQTRRWGSCTSVDRTIRISDRLVGMPPWVLDAVLVHELAHLIESNHGPRFQALVERYPHHLRAKGFLEGVSWQR